MEGRGAGRARAGEDKEEQDARGQERIRIQ